MLFHKVTWMVRRISLQPPLKKSKICHDFFPGPKPNQKCQKIHRFFGLPGMDHFLHDLVASFLLQRHVLGMLRGNGWRFLCCCLYTGEIGRDQHQYHLDRNQDVSNHGEHATSVCTYTYRWWNGVGSKFGIYCIDCGGGCYQLAVLFGQCQGADKRGSEKMRQEFFFWTWKFVPNDGPKIPLPAFS